MPVGFILVVGIALSRAGLCMLQSRHLARAGSGNAYATAMIRLRLALALAQGLAGLLMLAGLAAMPEGRPDRALPALVLIAVLQLLPDLLVSSAKIFSVDQRFGFNRSSREVFLVDVSRAVIMRAGLAGLLAAVALPWAAISPTWWWLPFVLASAAGAHFGGNMYKRLVEAKLLYHRHLEQGPLAERLRACAQRCGFADVHLVVARGSKRSRFANAHAEVLSGQARVVLLDTLADGLTPAQVEAVTAHELGHLSAGHLRQRFMLLCGIWLLVTASAWFIAANTFDPVEWKHLAAALILAQPLRFLMQPLLTSRLRVWEYQADAFAVRHVPRAELDAALRALVGLNAGTMASDPWFAAFYESHPPLTQRLRRLSEL